VQAGFLTPEREKSQTFSSQQWSCLDNGHSEGFFNLSRSQRRGRPGFAPEFPFSRPFSVEAAGHQHTIADTLPNATAVVESIVGLAAGLRQAVFQARSDRAEIAIYWRLAQTT
jgi:hypothetical protein